MPINLKDLFIKLLKLTNPLTLLPGILIFLFVTTVIFRYSMVAALLYTLIFVSISHVGGLINLSGLLLRRMNKIEENNVYLCYSNTNFVVVHYFFLTLKGEQMIRYDMSLSERQIVTNIDKSILNKTSAEIYNKEYAIIKLK